MQSENFAYIQNFSTELSVVVNRSAGNFAGNYSPLNMPPESGQLRDCLEGNREN